MTYLDAFLHYPFTEIRQNFNPKDKQLQNAHVCLYPSPNRREQYIGIAWGILFIFVVGMPKAS